ncbi:hypothetical protein [Thermoleptolyngbya sp.]
MDSIEWTEVLGDWAIGAGRCGKRAIARPPPYGIVKTGRPTPGT